MVAMGGGRFDRAAAFGNRLFSEFDVSHGTSLQF
jgi:hypothetical protein